MKILTYAVAGYLLLFGAAHAQTTGFLHCIDAEFDGRFELVQLEMAPSVLDPTVIYPNLASHSSCQRTLRTLGGCTGQGDLCSCQDYDGDGRFGVVKYPRPATNRVVLQANIGNYQGCEARRREVRDTGTQYHTCEDYDEDGRFGIVRHNVAPILQPAILARPDYGTYQDCTMFTRTFDGCGGAPCVSAWMMMTTDASASSSSRTGTWTSTTWTSTPATTRRASRDRAGRTGSARISVNIFLLRTLVRVQAAA